MRRDIELHDRTVTLTLIEKGVYRHPSGLQLCRGTGRRYYVGVRIVLTKRQGYRYRPGWKAVGDWLERNDVDGVFGRKLDALVQEIEWALKRDPITFTVPR